MGGHWEYRVTTNDGVLVERVYLRKSQAMRCVAGLVAMGKTVTIKQERIERAANEEEIS